MAFATNHAVLSLSAAISFTKGPSSGNIRYALTAINNNKNISTGVIKACQFLLNLTQDSFHAAVIMLLPHPKKASAQHYYA